MEKPQKVNFLDVADFLAFLPEEQLSMVQHLRAIIQECLPEADERLAYNVPFYYGRRRICFIWPAAVPWGKVPEHGVQLGLCQGHLIKEQDDYFQSGDRKQVSIHTFFKANEIDVDRLRWWLFAAWELDQSF